ncbi:hypothetical protein SS1G_02740 [Sclerotinia sclerotiorum 1980 UF-70]|uniref:Uncharacterized protein n=1 Tax=Sclerotinia sclerotiorum (strain ATCC 18683 / 1980 / Ss-1) TaxID=665079 RepID=A7EBQ4_SCLS1|nr:hypothetical protein SS1G_02740 [Sclerotinia sclerotiorum 1980 UF-70]EDN99882.1 hypothetical protein SS1G_02740 [Sclerotinia sclerotiorum 1980 UF-70]
MKVENGKWKITMEVMVSLGRIVCSVMCSDIQNMELMPISRRHEVDRDIALNQRFLQEISPPTTLKEHMTVLWWRRPGPPFSNSGNWARPEVCYRNIS